MTASVGPQASVEAQLMILNKLDNAAVHEFVESTLADWNGRSVSEGEMSAVIDKVTDLVQSALSTEKSSPPDVKFSTALSSLKEIKGRIGSKVDAAAADRLKMPREEKTVEDSLKLLDKEHPERHPAFREGWTTGTARRALDMPSTPIGSYVIVKERNRLEVLVKRESGTEQHLLEENEDAPGYTVWVEPSFMGGGSCSGIDAGASCSGLDEPSPVIAVDDTPSEPPEILGVSVTPLSRLKPEAESLLKLSSDFGQIQFSGYSSSDWNELKAASAKKVAPEHRPHWESTEANKRTAVDEINLAEATQRTLTRAGSPVFFHCNTVKAGELAFDCHQLPTDYSRDDVWLSLWEDAGKAGGRATIMKLSTSGCPGRNDLPVIRDYWPVKEGDPSIHRFNERCEQAEQQLNAVLSGKTRKVVNFKRSIQQNQVAKEKCEAELEELRQSRSSDSPVAATSSGETRESELVKLIERYQRKIDSDTKQLDNLLAAAKEHLDYVVEQKEKAAAGDIPGVYVGKFKTVDGITVENVDEKPLEGFPGAIVRKFKLTKDGEEPRIVTQIDYPKWADFSAAGAAVLPNLRSVYQKEHGDNPTPMKVHCRAGVGRTGTFISFCGAMDKIEKAVREGKVSELEGKKLLFEIITDARSQRDWQMVQQSVQAQQLTQALEEEVFKLALEAQESQGAASSDDR